MWVSAVPAALVNLLGVDLLAQVSYHHIVTHFFHLIYHFGFSPNTLAKLGRSVYFK